ncbi:MAG TPA: hypothetical protein VIM22_10345 [Solirubrobacteraceae bacterium]|jgi:hypothetical protein
MPRIIIRANSADDSDGPVMLQERILPQDLESDHYSAQLIERIDWAVGDARQAERADTEAPQPKPA